MIQELFKALNFGKTVTAHDKEWQIVHLLPEGYALAIPLGSKIPTITYIIRPDSKA